MIRKILLIQGFDDDKFPNKLHLDFKNRETKKAPILTELTSVSFGKEAQQKTLETFQFLQTQLSPFKLAS